MNKNKLYILVTIFFLFPFVAKAASLGEKLTGQILLDVERNGEAWYVYPEDNKRYYLGRPTDAFSIMRELGLGILERDFQRIAAAGMPIEGDIELARRLAGKIIIQVERNGEAWYIYPKDLKKYYLGRPKDAFKIMRELSLGIRSEDLAKIHKPGLEETINQYSNYKHQKITTVDGEFSIDVVEINLDNPNLKIITDTKKPYPGDIDRNSSRTYGANSLGEFALEHDAFAAVNGTYFDTGSSKRNYYFFPVLNSSSGELINEDQLKYWTTGPIMAFDENNKFYYFKDSREFPVKDWYRDGDGSAGEAFKKAYGVKLQAAIGNKPRLIEEKMNLLIEWDIDKKQRDTKALRNALAWKAGKDKNSNGTLYLVIARSATVPELANIMKVMVVDYALNLDGGYSSALWYNDEYMMGPGRDVPNVILFKE